MRGLITALRTLTCLPVPGRDAGRLAAALPFFPLVGLGIGLLAWAPLHLAAGWPAAGACGALAVLALVTRCLHLDGLADVADGLGCAGDRERTLAAMRDPACGAFGVAALVLVLLGKYLALARLAEHGQGLWLVAAVVAARVAQVDIAAVHPYARSEGTAARFVDESRPGHRLAAVAIGGGLLVGLGPWYPLALPAALLIGHAVALRLRLRLGGITGDVLGAASECAELAVLVGAAAAVGPLA